MISTSRVDLSVDAFLAVVLGETLLGSGGRFLMLGGVIGGLIMQAVTTTLINMSDRPALYIPGEHL